MVVDCDALNDSDLVVKREGGRFVRLDRIFRGQPPQVPETFNAVMWEESAS